MHRTQKQVQHVAQKPIKPVKYAQTKRTAHQKIQHRPQTQPEKDEQAKLPLPRVEGKGGQRAEGAEGKQRVAQRGQTCPPMPQGTQQIIDQPQRRTHHAGQKKLPRLQRDRQLHQPNSRAKKLPVGASSS